MEIKRRKRIKNLIKTTTRFVALGVGGIGLIYGLMYGLKGTLNYEESKDVIENVRAYDVNKDGLMDLIDKKGNYYFQTKEGNFVSYESVMQQEKAKLDSVYQTK